MTLKSNLEVIHGHMQSICGPIWVTQ